jgi:hypothetical protein
MRVSLRSGEAQVRQSLLFRLTSFAPNQSSRPPSKRYVDALHARIESLEKQLREVQHARPAGHPTGPSHAAPPPIRTNSMPFDRSHSPPRTPDSTLDPVDELTELYGRLDVAEDGHLRYFGPPSYFNLLRESQFRIVQSGPASPQLESPIGARSTPVPIEMDLSHETQAHLLDLYWKWQNPWQYLVHQSRFCEAFEKGYYDDYVTPLLLHCVLALSTRYSDREELRTNPNDPNTAGEILGRKARDLLQTEIEHPTTSTVASLAILALREASVNKEALGWTYIGKAFPCSGDLAQSSSPRTCVQARLFV